MIEPCAGFSLITQSVSVSGGDEDLTFNTLRFRSGRHMIRVQFMTDVDSIIILVFYIYNIF